MSADLKFRRKRCVICGNLFAPLRPHARTCSKACRAILGPRYDAKYRTTLKYQEKYRAAHPNPRPPAAERIITRIKKLESEIERLKGLLAAEHAK